MPTTPLEAILIGNYFVISKGALDVLPDEGALGLVAAHSLGHLVRGHPLVHSRFAFPDLVSRLGDAEVFAGLALRQFCGRGGRGG